MIRVKTSLAVLMLATAAIAPAQKAVDQGSSIQPLTAIPYSPSLDLTSLDRTAEPCSDFYRFTCGGWRKTNPIPPDQASWNVYSKLAMENQQFLWGILQEDAAASNRTPVQQKVGDYFASCMNLPVIDALGEKPVQPALGRIQALTTRAALLAGLASINHDDPGTFFFSAGVGQDAVDASVPIVELGSGGLGLPDRDYYLKTDAKSLRLREQYVAYVQQLLVLSGQSQPAASLQAGQVLAIETALAKATLSRVDRRDPHKTYHLYTLAQLSQLAPAVDWSAYLRIQGATPPATLNVSQPEFLRKPFKPSSPQSRSTRSRPTFASTSSQVRRQLSPSPSGRPSSPSTPRLCAVSPRCRRVGRPAHKR